MKNYKKNLKQIVHSLCRFLITWDTILRSQTEFLQLHYATLVHTRAYTHSDTIWWTILNPVAKKNRWKPPSIIRSAWGGVTWPTGKERGKCSSHCVGTDASERFTAPKIGRETRLHQFDQSQSSSISSQCQLLIEIIEPLSCLSSWAVKFVSVCPVDVLLKSNWMFNKMCF